MADTFQFDESSVRKASFTPAVNSPERNGQASDESRELPVASRQEEKEPRAGLGSQAECKKESSESKPEQATQPGQEKVQPAKEEADYKTIDADDEENPRDKNAKEEEEYKAADANDEEKARDEKAKEEEEYKAADGNDEEKARDEREESTPVVAKPEIREPELDFRPGPERKDRAQVAQFPRAVLEKSVSSANEIEIEEVIYENERYLPGRGWSKHHLLALDPHAYINARDRRARGSTPDEASLSTLSAVGRTQRWLDPEWRVSIQPNSTDDSGWQYSSRFSSAAFSANKSMCVVRRRTWRRRRLADTQAEVNNSPHSQGNYTFDNVIESSASMRSNRRARLIELAQAMRVDEEALAAEEIASGRVSATEKRWLRERASEAATRLAKLSAQLNEAEQASTADDDDTKLDGLRDAVQREHFQLDECFKREMFPGYDPRMVIRGDGVAIGVKSIHLEKVAGQVIVHAHPSPDMPQILVEAMGADDASTNQDPDSIQSKGLAIQAVVEDLRIRTDRRGGSLPSSLRMKRLSLRAEVAVSARLSFTSRLERSSSGEDDLPDRNKSSHSRQTWRVDVMSIRLQRWSTPGLLSKSTASAVVGLIRPTLKRLLCAALPRELGFTIRGLRSPLVVAGEFCLRAATPAAVLAAKLDADNEPRAEQARALLGWTLSQAQAFARARDELAKAMQRPLRLHSLADVVAYVRRFDDDAFVPLFSSAGKGMIIVPPHLARSSSGSQNTPFYNTTTSAAEAQRRFERRARLDGNWSQVAALWAQQYSGINEKDWHWTELRDAARELRRRPLELSLRFPTVCGAMALNHVHAYCWQRMMRVAQDIPDADKARRLIEATKRIRDEAKTEISTIAKVVSAAEARVSVEIGDEGVRVDVVNAKLATPTFPLTDSLKVLEIKERLTLDQGRIEKATYLPCGLRVRHFKKQDDKDDFLPPPDFREFEARPNSGILSDQQLLNIKDNELPDDDMDTRSVAAPSEAGSLPGYIGIDEDHFGVDTDLEDDTEEEAALRHSWAENLSAQAYAHATMGQHDRQEDEDTNREHGSGVALDFIANQDDDQYDTHQVLCFATVALVRPRFEMALADAFRRQLPATPTFPPTDEKLCHSILGVELASDSAFPTLRISGTPQLVGRGDCDRVAVAADPRTTIDKLRELFVDVDSLRTWWPEEVDETKCADAVDVLDLLRSQVFPESRKADAAPVGFRLSTALCCSIRSDDHTDESKAPNSDVVVSAATVQGGIRLHTHIFARDLIVASIDLASRIHNRRLFGVGAVVSTPLRGTSTVYSRVVSGTRASSNSTTSLH